SNNSANRGTPDVPMFIPDVNTDHTQGIEAQKKRLGTKRGFIAVKPNCSIQTYVPALTPLLDCGIEFINVSTYQAVSGAGKTLESFEGILDNIIPYIGGEEEKSEKEPLKVWGKVEDGVIVNADKPVISAQCVRVPVSDGHLATVSVKFTNPPTEEQMLEAWKNFKGEPQRLELPSAPKQFITYFEEENRPQTGVDRNTEGGMGICVGRLRKDTIFDYKFVCLSHNTLRGAAGGGLLTAEFLYAKGLLD
ncbi:MAG: aspartate-semialdehyde dehydrogenase, partial [Clostridia bacterium]|nr:aspartate-semialdehyde dehydrogenase [Clostridia bacterium]